MKATADREEDRRKKLETWPLQFGSHLGQLPLDGRVPVAGADRFSVRSGVVMRTGATLHFTLVFERPAVGAAALARWLSQRGFVDFKYEFSFLPADDND